MSFNKHLLEILCCPKCKKELILTNDESGLICRQCSLLYVIRDGIPVLLIDEAVAVQEEGQF